MQKHTFCPRCGTQMQTRLLEGRARDVCTACDYIFYRNPVPAVGVVVEHQNGIVLVKRKYEPRANFWSLPAGYLELDESTEAAAVRECCEETSLDVRINALLGVYSFGAGAYSGLVIIYAASVVGGTLQAADDAADAQVFDPDQLPSPLAFSTHVQAIEDWRQYRRRQLRPILPPTLPRSSELHVRPARVEDAPQIFALLRLVLQHQLHENDQAVMTVALLRRRVNDPDNPILVAERDGRVVGFVALTFRRTLTGWRAAIEDLVVAPDYRRRRVGQTLVRAAVSLARSRNCLVMHLDAPYASPDVLQSFARACGFAGGTVGSLLIGSYQGSA